MRHDFKIIQDGTWFNIESHNYPVTNLRVTFSDNWYIFNFEDEDGFHSINFDTYHIRHYCDGLRFKTTNAILHMMDDIIKALMVRAYGASLNSKSHE